MQDLSAVLFKESFKLFSPYTVHFDSLEPAIKIQHGLGVYRFCELLDLSKESRTYLFTWHLKDQNSLAAKKP